MLYKRTQARKKYPLNCALMMSPRMVTKRLQANCQARRTDQQPPDQQPINMGLAYITSVSISREKQIDLQMSVFLENSPIWVQVEHKVDGNSGTAPT
ncbi:hypothetical protein T265_03253 [Opisthorchis viverrini]|uniref:Uncharacterized protein n=1 Tax=Opisthorchis viverrini TaxID=6198 RepID=A0A074ZT67_OPIVI|nr:hypothetical protein T265_03253 [Opisthorchis viverrini]KER30306.1 hypothetical protein T265_03253 [Opisthorchis viverrini]